MQKDVDSIFFENTPRIQELARKCEENNAIERELYTQYEVKRGLRDLNGKGVLAGLTNGEWDHDSCEATVSTKDADHATIMREQLMGYRKQRFAALFCEAAVIMLGG